MAGVGIIVFAVLAMAMLYSEAEPGAHPLADKRTVDLCKELGTEVWFQLAYPALDPVVRVPASAEEGDSMCALEIDPVDPADRWARVARGENADQVQQIAVVTVATSSYLRHQSPDLTTSGYFQTFDKELVADGWQRRTLDGPWIQGNAYTGSGERVAALVEDDGIVIWIASEGVDAVNLEVFSRSVAARLRE